MTKDNYIKSYKVNTYTFTKINNDMSLYDLKDLYDDHIMWLEWFKTPEGKNDENNNKKDIETIKSNAKIIWKTIQKKVKKDAERLAGF
tara:strand:+ start:530 stop:793 length:264 start_codon:yes stop_codon:yes gene_type:complete